METFGNHLNQKLKSERFRKLYEEDRQLAELALKIHGAREELGLSQQEVAEKARVTQQQLSKVENGVNCNISTFLRICNALELRLDLGIPKRRRKPA